MVQVTERSTGGKYFIEKEEGKESYVIIDVSTGDQKGEAFPTRRDAAKELKELNNPTADDNAKPAAADEADA